MARYYFDTRDGAEFIRDELGIELDGIEAARDEATRGLADPPPRNSSRARPGPVWLKTAPVVRTSL